MISVTVSVAVTYGSVLSVNCISMHLMVALLNPSISVGDRVR